MENRRCKAMHVIKSDANESPSVRVKRRHIPERSGSRQIKVGANEMIEHALVSKHPSTFLPPSPSEWHTVNVENGENRTIPRKRLPSPSSYFALPT